MQHSKELKNSQHIEDGAHFTEASSTSNLCFISAFRIGGKIGSQLFTRDEYVYRACSTDTDIQTDGQGHVKKLKHE